MPHLTIVNPSKLDARPAAYMTPAAPRPGRSDTTKPAAKKVLHKSKHKKPFGKATITKQKVAKHKFAKHKFADSIENTYGNSRVSTFEATKHSSRMENSACADSSALSSCDIIGFANKRAKYGSDGSTDSVREDSLESTSHHSLSRQSDATGTSGEPDTTDVDSEIATYTNPAKFSLPHFLTDRHIPGRESAITDSTLTPDSDIIDSSIVQKARETFARFIAERSCTDVSSDQAIPRSQSAPTVPASGLDTLSSLGLYLDHINNDEPNDDDYGQFCDFSSDHSDADSDDDEVSHYYCGHHGPYQRKPRP